MQGLWARNIFLVSVHKVLGTVWCQSLGGIIMYIHADVPVATLELWQLKTSVYLPNRYYSANSSILLLHCLLMLLKPDLKDPIYKWNIPPYDRCSFKPKLVNLVQRLSGRSRIKDSADCKTDIYSQPVSLIRGHQDEVWPAQTLSDSRKKRPA